MYVDCYGAGLVGGDSEPLPRAGGETPRVADSSAAGACRFLTAYLLLTQNLGDAASGCKILESGLPERQPNPLLLCFR